MKRLLNTAQKREAIRFIFMGAAIMVYSSLWLFPVALKFQESWHHLYVIEQLEQGISPANATIINCEYRSSRGDNYYLCDYHYTLAGQTYAGNSSYPGSYPKKEQGDTIAIGYAPSDPSVSIITYKRTHFNDSYGLTWSGIISMACFYFAVLLVGILGGGFSYSAIKDLLALLAKDIVLQADVPQTSQLKLILTLLLEDIQATAVVLLLIIMSFATILFEYR